MADEDDRPYTTYRARPRFLKGKDDDGVDPRVEAGDKPEYKVHGGRRRLSPRALLPGRRRTGSPGRRITVGRVLRYVALAALEPHFVQRLATALEVVPEELSRERLSRVFAGRSAAAWEQWATERDIPLVAVVDHQS